MYIIASMRLLTNRQVRFLSDMIAYIREEHRPPTSRELQHMMGFRSPRSVGQYLETLEKAGYIKRGKGARNIKILQPPPVPQPGIAKTVRVPIVGSAPCGIPFLAEQNIEDYVSVSVKLAKPPYRYFILRVKGDSMNEANIPDGGMVLVRQQATARDGQIVVALIDDEATIKKLRLSKGKGYVSLEPVSSNPEHRSILLEREFQIQGVVVKAL